ncbi:MAG: hypothetical protein HN348_01745 [Proteobacteria bacterium]|nr:hypothetical protein [Pseudomonadota bacterium]
MDPVIVVGILGIVGFFGLVLWLNQWSTGEADRFKEALEQTARNLGVDEWAVRERDRHSPVRRTASLETVVEGVHLSIESFVYESGDATSRRALITAKGKTPKGIRFSEGVLAESPIEGDEVWTAAVMNEKARLAVLDAVAQGFHLSCGEIEAGISLGTNADSMTFMARTAIEVAKHLRLKWTIEQNLLRNSQQASSQVVRRKNLSLLLQHFPDSVEAKEAAKEAYLSQDVGIALMAALIVGADGKNIVRRCAAIHLEEACELFGNYEDNPDLVYGMLEGVKRNYHGTSYRALKLLVGRGYGLSHKEMADLLARTHGELRTLVLQRMRILADPATESALLALGLEEDDPDLLLMIMTLGEVGTVRSVEELSPFAEMVFGSIVKRAALSAIDAIQSRVKGAEAGLLSLATPRGGQLSVAQSGSINVRKVRT